jgi:hypothetical protein
LKAVTIIVIKQTPSPYPLPPGERDFFVFPLP